MTVCTLTSKGQLVLPVSLRRKLNLTKGTRLAVTERAGEIVIRPVTDAYIDSLCGCLEAQDGDASATEDLLREHARDARRDGSPA